ncbi:winged helix-turn-helix domain-containing protein [Pseudoalteromonas luteoviolacea]|uniref:winged helix-turn-helix domain-containing protein n=1 Tax=Pseudoalteromonas luteoviolacea TaxID=43657 RepID=UPI001B388871|nr:winged helix-turn-helix domain-containing protein [Pseudoalteromonas luteoviolacea]MBQ4836244.1 winged helix-turn-helix domain-containing protein [Pseudoalteromonas luteoviolacea]
MKLAFDDFQFDIQALTLSKDGRKISLKEKPAQILALLITQPDKIHSKVEILEEVWPGRTVTEQVVFQNIGHLRALFGDEAIKTFSKKGYQWQLPCDPVDGKAPAVSESLAPDSAPISADPSVNTLGEDSAQNTANASAKLPWQVIVPVLVAAAAITGYFALT